MAVGRSRVPRRLPVLLVNGFSPFPIPLHLAVAQLRERGFEAKVVGFRMSEMRDVTRLSRHVADDLRKLQWNFGVSRVNLVGYSMGGVAALYALKRLGIAPDVAAFAALGSPFHGSSASWFAVPSGIFSRTGGQLVPGSPFLRDLHEDPLPAGPRYLAIGGEKDFICPPETARLEGARNVTLPLHHWHFILDPKVADLLADHLV